MTNKLLTGARRAGVLFALALMGLGIGGAWADSYTVDLSKIEIKYTSAAADADSICYDGNCMGADGKNVAGNNTFLVGNGAASATPTAFFPISATFSGSTKLSDTVLTIGITGTNDIKIIGQYKATNKPYALKILAANTVTWDGGDIVGHNAGGAKTKTSFIDVSESGAKFTLVSGKIEAWSKYILDAAEVSAPTATKHQFGSSAPAGANIELKAHGRAALYGTAVVVNNPGTGKYTITADSSAIIAKTSVSIGTVNGVEAGEIQIDAWGVAASSAIAATADAAIKIEGDAGDFDDAIVEVYGRGNKVTISSKGKYVIWVPASDEDAGSGVGLYLKKTLIKHTVPTGTAGAIVLNAGESTTDVLIEECTVEGSTSSAALVGQLVTSVGDIIISKGTYAAATGTSGNAITTKGDVRIESAKITANAMSTTAKPDYVVSSEGNVFVLAGSASTDSAVVAWTGSGNGVGAVKAKTSVKVISNGSRKAEVRVGNATSGGTGTAIYVYGISPGAAHTVNGYTSAATEAVSVIGSANGSAIVKANTGHAILVPNDDAVAVATAVKLSDAVVARTGTPAAGLDYLVKVTGGNIEVNGANLTSTAVNVAVTGTTSLGVGLFASKNPAGTVGGDVTVKGGSIAGKTGAIEAVNVTITGETAGDRKSVDIKSTDGVTVKASANITVNNPAATITNTNGVFGNAVVQSTDGNITITQVASITGTTQATALLTTSTDPAKGKVLVNGGTIKSGVGPAIVSSNKVEVDKTTNVVVLVTTGTAGQTATNPWNAAIYADGARITSGETVRIGNATVEATAANGYGAAVRTINNGHVLVGDSYADLLTSDWYNTHTAGGTVRLPAYVSNSSYDTWYTGTSGTVGHSVTPAGVTAFNTITGNFYDALADGKAIVKSVSGNAISVVGGNVWFVAGEVKSEGKVQPQAGTAVAAIHVTDGKIVNVGRETKTSKITSEGNALAVFSTGATTCLVNVGTAGTLEVKGTVATAGAIRVTGYSEVAFAGNLTISTANADSKAFAIEAATGKIDIYDGRVKAEACADGAVRSTGAPINITGGFVTANSGVLVWAKKNTSTNRAGRITINEDDGSLQDWSTYVRNQYQSGHTCVYNRYGTAVKAEDTVDVQSGLVGTDADTAIAAGTANVAGVVNVSGGIVWAAGAYDKTTGVAIASKKVFVSGGTVEANTPRSSIDNEEMYSNAKVTGILLRPAKGGGEGNLEITGNAYIKANGASLGIDNRDTLVTVIIKSPTVGAGTVWITAGNNGTGIKSVGEISTTGARITEDSGPDETHRYPKVQVYIRTGNGPEARAILMPIETGAKKKELNLLRTMVEAGSNGSVAIDGGKNTLINVDHSVVLVRHASTAVRGLGGVYVDGGYVEVLATENNNTGTAILGNEINISGGHGDVEDKSEIHAKGIAVKDTINNTPIEVTGIIHMSGTVATKMNIGSSVMGDTGTLSMGSEKSRNLWKLSAASDVTISRERGKALIIPAGVTVSVADNTSKLETEKYDTLKIAGNVTTVGKQAGAQFVNGGKVVIDKGGNVSFNKSAASSLKNSNGTFVLKTGSLLDSVALLHDSGTNITGVQYTFLKFAKILSGDSVGTVGTRGPGKVIIPPLYAALYGNPRLFVDDDDMETATKDFWDANSTRTDSVYTAKYVKYPLDKRYKKYINAGESDTAKGDYTLGGLGTVRVDEDGTVLLTEAGTFQRVAVMENEAGIGTKTYTHIVSRVDYNRIKAAQTTAPVFFDGFVNNADGRVDVAKDTILIRQDGNVAVKYTGKTARLVDGAVGAKTGYKDLDTDKDIYYDGLGVVTFWYSAAGNEMFLLSSNPPTTVGTYNVWASMSDAGRNFEQVPSGESKIVPIGQVKVTAGDIESVFDKNGGVYQIIVELEAKIARPRVTVQLPSVAKFGAKYDVENILITGTARDALTSEPTISATTANDSTLTFGVDANTDFSQNIDMKVTILNNAEPPNFIGGQSITVRVIFRTKEEMKEITPNYITVNYRDSKLSGLLAGTTYLINGSTRVTAITDTTAILPAWIGDTITVQALKTTEFKFDSDVAKIYIGNKLQINEALRAVTADSASTTLAADGRLAHTTVAMEYKLSTDIGWKPASAVATDGLKAGTYYIRLAPIMTIGNTPGAFASDSLTVKIFSKAVIAVAEGNREIPTGSTTTEAAVAPVKIAAAAFTAGPSPASKASGEIAFFSTKAVKSGTLYIFDATGKTVAKVKASGAGKIGSWNLSTAAEGSYVVKGALVGKDGTKEKVSFVFSVTK